MGTRLRWIFKLLKKNNNKKVSWNSWASHIHDNFLHVSLLIYKVLHNRTKCNKGRRVNRINPCHRSLIMLNVKLLWISRMNQLPHCVLSLYNTDVSSIWPHVLYFITPLWLIHRMRMSTISTNVGRWHVCCRCLNNTVIRAWSFKYPCSISIDFEHGRVPLISTGATESRKGGNRHRWKYR